jgi:hypothetical protein
MEDRKMTIADFLALPEHDLIAFWICDQVKDYYLDNVAAALTSYEAYGRTGVAEILAGAEYTTREQSVTMISLAKAKELLTKMKNNNDFTIISVDFIKRTTGELRRMVCRFGVKTGLAGGVKSRDDAEHELKTVWDMQKNAYRSISLESVIRMKIHGKKYLIEENKALADKFQD